MVSTKAGWLDGKEIVEVVFDAKVTSYRALLKQARCVKDPSTAYVYDQESLEVAKRVVGTDAVLIKTAARVAKTSDQKYYLRQTPYFLLPLTRVQAARLNAVIGDKKIGRDPRAWLSPSQLALLAAIEKRFRTNRQQLQKLTPARDPKNFASYTAALRWALAN